MEDDRLEEGRYGRAFGYSEPDDEDEESDRDVEAYLRSMKRKKADKEGTSPKQDEPHQSDKDNTSIGVSDESESADDDGTIPHRTDKKTTPFGIGKNSDGITSDLREYHPGEAGYDNTFQTSVGRISPNDKEKYAVRHRRFFGLLPGSKLIRRLIEQEEDITGGSRWLSWHYSRSFGKRKRQQGNHQNDPEEDSDTPIDEDKERDGSKEDVSERSASGRQSSFTDRNTGTPDESRSASKNDSNDIQKTPVRGRPQGDHSLYPTGDQNGKNDRSVGNNPASLSGKSENKSASQAGSSFRVGHGGADRKKEAEDNQQKLAASDKEGSAYQGVFNIAGEELEAGKNFIKGKTRFARSIGEEDPDAAEVGTKALQESGRTVIQAIGHIITQIKNIVILIVTMVFGPVAGAIVAIIAELLLLLIIVIIIVVLIVIGVIVLAVTVITTFVSFIVGLFVDDYNNTAEMYRYAALYAAQYEQMLEEEASAYENVVIYRDDVKTTWTEFTINYEDAYLVYLGENQEAEYKNVKLELAEGSVAGNLPELQADTEENRAALESAFAGLYYTEVSEDETTLMIHVNTPFLYMLQHPQDNQNVYYITTAVSRDSGLREDFGMLEDPLEIKYPREE